MKSFGLLLLACVCVYGAPVTPALEPGNCQDPFTTGAAEQALTRINHDRRQGYVFALNRISNAHHMKHGPTGVVFYLTLDVLETKCHVLSKRDWKSCEVRQEADTPVYGQCKAAVYIDKVKRIVRLYKYSCLVRPAPASRIVRICPDCPTAISLTNESVLKAVNMAVEKYNKESGNANYFKLLIILRASSQSGIAEFTFADFTIQETVCANSTDITKAAKCTLMDCEFAHKGHCSASYNQSPDEDSVTVDCDIFEPEDAEKEKQRHLLGEEHDFSHNRTQDHTHGDTQEHDHSHGHGQAHYHTHEHDHVHHHNNDQDRTHKHGYNHTQEHDHTNDHAHNHTHDHTHEHDHTHDHAHNQTHDHVHDHIHYYGDHHHHHHHHHHGNHTHAHVHDHDHVHNHKHLHAHEHHHHHHDHAQLKTVQEQYGNVHYVPDMDKPAIMPSFTDQPQLERPVIMPSVPEQPPASGPNQAVTLPVFPDAEPQEEKEPQILPFPSGHSPQCLMQPKRDASLINKLFDEDPLFNPAAAV